MGYASKIFIFSVGIGCLSAHVPFNPALDKNCEPVKFDSDQDILRGSLRMFKKNSLEMSFAYNATRSLEEIVFIWDKNWHNIVSKKPEPWVQWNKEDEDQKRLFRYFIFYDVMGIMEHDFRKLDKECQKQYLQSELVRRPAAVDPEVSPFFLKSVGQLTKEFKNYKKGHLSADAPGYFTVLDGYKILKEQGLMEALHQTDIRYLQASNPGAAFQLASNFDCLEGDVAKSGLEGMNKRPVQGENAVSCTMGAGILRAYFVKPEKRDLLSGLSNKFDKNNHGLVRIDGALSIDDIKNISVGVHKNVVVTSGYYAPFIRTQEDDLTGIGGIIRKGDNYPKSTNALALSNKKIPHDRIEFLFKNKIASADRNPVYAFNGAIEEDSLLVHQIFAASFNLHDMYAENGKPVTRKDRFVDGISQKEGKQQQKNAQIVLKAMYKGTVLSAALLGCKKLFLTLVGAGAFYNEVAWIMEALHDELILESIRYTGIEVVLVIFPDIRSGRGLDGKNFNEIEEGVLSENDLKQGKRGTALKKIYEHVDALNAKIMVNSFARALQSI